MYSQNDEERVILEVFDGRPPARLLDIGAYDGKTFSNTLALIERGWGGVLVEPAPRPFLSLVERHGKNPEIVLVNCALFQRAGFSLFHDSRGDAVSTISDNHAVAWSTQVPHWDEYLVWTVEPQKLLKRVGHDFAFVSIDVEGCNVEVFQAMPWGLLEKLQLVCVEHEGEHEMMGTMLAPFGFRPLALNAENAIFRRP
jgi:FkbM family methyltransferase